MVQIINQEPKQSNRHILKDMTLKYVQENYWKGL